LKNKRMHLANHAQFERSGNLCFALMGDWPDEADQLKTKRQFS